MDEKAQNLVQELNKETHYVKKYKLLLELVTHLFQTQRPFLASLNAVVKDKDELSSEELKAVQDSIKSMAMGSALIEMFFVSLLEKEYKVN